jgi:hypothetical protein
MPGDVRMVMNLQEQEIIVSLLDAKLSDLEGLQ